MSTEALKIGPVDQTQLVLYASKNTSLSACDLAVLAEITDRYLKLKGVTYPTGLTHLVRETGRSHSSVQDSVRRLLSFAYISVKVEGKGTRGTEYDLNFDWVREVAERVKCAKADRTRAKKSKGKKKASVPADHTTTENKLVCRNSTPLRELVGVPTDTLGNPAYRNSGTQTYGSTTSTPKLVAKNSHSGLVASAVSAPLREEYIYAEITHAELDTEEEDRPYIYIELTADGTGEEIGDSFIVFSANDDEWADGRRRLKLLSDAIQVEIEVKDPRHLIGEWVVAKKLGGRILDYLEEMPPTRRDATILSVKATEAGEYRVELQFHDCEEGDAPTATIKLSSTNSLQTATSRTARELVGARVLLDAYEEAYVFWPHPENEKQAA
ncbi:hypothetical protein [Phyllobacterium bourgognense]|uniref:Helix-turn-helix protein n=1 Tax=Phyllobacterium bourgognense TaxID=314236 RepID=A0A368YL08_9HYPH|nr:hypothetical protein [Phyllobacterium bourgognense]RCW80921.1 hypothetical protein C7476_11277 [Phyllobacterium bourgognense]